MNTNKVKTIDLTGKEWWRRGAGGNYVSCQVTVNFGLPDAKTFYCRMQGGSSDFYEQMAMTKLCRAEVFPKEAEKRALWAWCRENDIILRRNLHTNCKEKEVIEWGTNPNLLFNYKSPDGFSVSPIPFETKQEAKRFLKKWLKQYQKQGYYSSNDFGRIEYNRIENFCFPVEIEPD